MTQQQPKRVFILLGAPGAGKGTQAQHLVEKFSLYHIDTGHCLRSEIASQSDLGRQAKAYMDQGQLVPFDLVMQVIKASLLRIADDKKGYLFDGFPRNLQQAEGLKGILQELGLTLNAAVYMDIDHEELMDRLAYRITCGQCDTKYNLKLKPPHTENVCDACSGELVTRKDDKPEVIENRLKTYASETEPLIAYYDAQGVLKRVNADQPIKTVSESIDKEIEPFFHPSDRIMV